MIGIPDYVIDKEIVWQRVSIVTAYALVVIAEDFMTYFLSLIVLEKVKLI